MAVNMQHRLQPCCESTRVVQAMQAIFRTPAKMREHNADTRAGIAKMSPCRSAAGGGKTPARIGRVDRHSGRGGFFRSSAIRQLVVRIYLPYFDLADATHASLAGPANASHFSIATL